MEMSYYLPEEMLPFKDKLLGTKVEFIEIIPEENVDLKPWNSKFGGYPYLPKDTPFPTNPAGEHLFFLAQINFAELPAMPPFPESGIIQIYIFDDGNFGQDAKNYFSQENFKILYFPTVEEDENLLQADFSFLRMYSENLPVYPENTHGMSFEKRKEIVPVSDHQFANLVAADFFDQFGDDKWEVLNVYKDEVSAEGHKMGGYAHFAQEDPRSTDNPMLLLFQMDTDMEIESMWGDMGTANFFISKEDLEKRDFSKVMYNWDCH